ncbi:hypothetical protein CC80DRAFT_464954 [Byssothecium circinans]|uniref:Uncharacterized protein n=1 Tax=Byssothecium circinans TaxID=147558 RepID=A0A6A5U8Q1_9PLEO|nr:hypothetical protein CC80DRAFT_464954 [Byssothecium circinans]
MPIQPSATSAASFCTKSGRVGPTTPARPTYWQKFPGFEPKVDASFLEQFNKLAIHEGWTKKEKMRRRNEAIEEEFNYLQGTDIGKLERWQDLCCIVGIEDVPDTISKCKKVLSSGKVMVNLTNLIDHMRLGTPLIKFRNFGAFRSYTLKHRFPKSLAKKEGFINVLLRHVA